MSVSSYTDSFHVLVKLDRIQQNLRGLQEYVAPAEVMAIVKSNAYGVGSYPLAELYQEQGIRYLGVFGVEEALELREQGIGLPILNLSSPTPEVSEKLIRHDITQSIHSRRMARSFAEFLDNRKGTLHVHLNIDTGLHRLGVSPEAAVEVGRRVHEHPQLRLEGIYSTLVEEENWDETQFQRFKDVVQTMEEEGVEIQLRHLVSSAGLHNKKMHLDMVRPGMTLLGYDIFGRADLDLHPSLRIRSRIVHTTEVTEGEPVGYDATFIAPEDMTVATVAGGYAEGIPRSFSETGKVIVEDRSYPIVGRISANHCLVDITGEESISEGGSVSFVDESHQSLLQFTSACGISLYKFLCGLSGSVPFVYRFEDRDRYIRSSSFDYREPE